LDFVEYVAGKPAYARFRIRNFAPWPVYFSGRSLSQPLYTIFIADREYPGDTAGWRPVGPGWCGNHVHAVSLGSGEATDFDVRADSLACRSCRVGLQVYVDDELMAGGWVMAEVLKPEAAFPR
jgi:hypothetical protein